MGRTALVAGCRTIDNRGGRRRVRTQMSVLHEIRELLAAPLPADSKLLLERLDETLTAGYAYALQLESDRWRAERRLGEVAADIGGPGGKAHVEELTALAGRVKQSTEEI